MKLFLLLITVLWSMLTIAQPTKPSASSYILSYPQDGWGIVKAPFYWKKKEWGCALVGTALIYAVFTVDEDVQHWIHKRPDNYFANGWLSGSRHWGDGLYSLPVFAGLYFYGKFQHNQMQQLVAMNATKAFVLSRLFVQIPKYLFQRHPPALSGNARSTLFDGPVGDGNNRSFPSGHVISAFAAAEVFRSGFENCWVGGLAYTLASTVAIHRVASGSHWLSDVTTSVFLGTAIGYWISHKGNTRFSLFGGGLPNSSVSTLGLAYSF